MCQAQCSGFYTCDLGKPPQRACEGGISVPTLQMEKVSLGGGWVLSDPSDAESSATQQSPELVTLSSPCPSA